MSSNRPFIRNVELIIGPLAEDAGGGPISQGFRIYSTGDRQSLRVRFAVKKTILGAPNPSTIQVYNLSRSNIERIRNTLTRVRLQVGWNNTDLELLARGGIQSTITEKQGAEFVTTFTVLDGWGGQVKGITNRTYGQRARVADIVRDVAGNMPGVSVGDIDIDGTIGNGGLTVSDRSADVLDRLAAQYGFSWSIQDGTFQAIQDTRAFSQLIEISSTKKNLVKVTPILQTAMQIQTGIEIQAIMNPRVRPGSQIKLTSDLNPRLNGIYKVHEVDFEGDTSDQSWLMTVRCLNFG